MVKTKKRVKGFDHTKLIPHNLCKYDNWGSSSANERMLFVIACMAGGVNHLTPRALKRLDKALALEEGKLERLLQRLLVSKRALPLWSLLDHAGNLK